MRITRPWKKRDLALLSGILAVGMAVAWFFAFPKTPAHYQGRDAYEWAKRLEWPPDQQSRDEAAAALLAMGSEAVPLLHQRLAEKIPLSQILRQWLGTHLPGRLGGMFTRNFKPVSQSSVRRAAALGLRVLGTNAAPAIPTLVRLLREPDPEARWTIAAALGEAGGEAVMAVLPLLTDPDPNVRHSAAYVLGQIGPPALAAVPALVRSLNDPFPPVRNSSLYSLSRVGSVAGPDVLHLVETTSGAERLAALKALTAVRPRGQLTLPLLTNLANNSEPTHRAAVLETMQQLFLTHTNAVNVYLAALSDTNAVVRLAAANALAAAAHKSGIAANTLTALTHNDPDADVRTAAGVALEKIASHHSSGRSP